MSSFISGSDAKDPPPTDLALLWRKAFFDYNASVGEKAKKKGYQLNINGIGFAPNLESVRNTVTDKSDSFQKWRHNGGTLDKVRSVISDSLGYAQTIGDQLIAAAAVPFPAAGAIWTVATYAIKACQGSSTDYNNLIALLGETGNFLKTLQIIEEKVPRCKIYKECVTDALTALVVVFAIQTRFMSEGRGLRFWNHVKGGLGGDADGPEQAYSKVTAAIDRLSRANGLMAVRNTEDIKTLVTSLGGKIDSLYEDMLSSFEQQGRMIQDGFQGQEKFIGEGFGQQGRLIQDGFQDQKLALAINFQLLQDIRRNQLAQSIKQESTTQSKSTAKDLTSRSSNALNKARQFYGPKANPTTKFKDLERSYVPGSDAWLSEDDAYRSWLDGKTPLLWLGGEAGVGKSHLAFATIKLLQKMAKSKPRMSVAYFFFQEELEEFRSCKNALCSAGFQFATQDHKIRESIASTWTDERCADLDTQVIWLMGILEYFKADSEAELFLVFDGIDEAEVEMQQVMDFLSIFQDTPEARIHVLLTGRPNALLWVNEMYEDVQVPILEVTEERSRKCLQGLLKSRLESLPRLSRLRSSAKSTIAKKMLNSSFGPLFVDRFLKDLDSKGLERPILKALQAPPNDLSSLYNDILRKCNANRTVEEANALHYVFSWLAYAKRPLTLREVNCLMVLKLGRKVLDLEEEIAGKCASILQISSSLPDQDEDGEDKWDGKLLEEDTKPQISNNSVKAPNGQSSAEIEDESTLILTFQERSLRDFIIDAVDNLRLSTPLDLFVTTVDLLCGEAAADPSLETARAGLQNYAAYAWMKHFHDLILTKSQRQAQTKEQSTAIAETLYSITSNQNNASQVISQHTDVCYDDFVDFLDHIPEKMQDFARIYLDHNKFVSRSNVLIKWAEQIVLEPTEALQPLARGHVSNWFQQRLRDPAIQAYKMALKAYKTRSYVASEFDDGDSEKGEVQPATETVELSSPIENKVNGGDSEKGELQQTTKTTELSNPIEKKVNGGDGEKREVQQITKMINGTSESETKEAYDKESLIRMLQTTTIVTSKVQINNANMAESLNRTLQRTITIPKKIVDDDEQTPEQKENDVIELSRAFKDIPKGASAYRAIGLVLTDLNRWETATATLMQSRQLCTTDEDRFATLVALAAMEEKRSDAGEDFEYKGFEYIDEALSLPRPELTEEGKQLIQFALWVRGWGEIAVNEPASAAESLEEAMTFWSKDNVTIFSDMIRAIEALGQNDVILEKVQKWGSIRLAMESQNGDDLNRRYQKAAKLAGKDATLIATYEALIKDLEPQNWASPSKYQYGLACRRSLNEVPKAKRLLYEILDSNTCIDPVTGTFSDSTLYLARRELSDILFEEFRTVSSWKEKQKLLKEMEELPNRTLGSIFSADDLFNNPNTTILARMYRKLGPPEKFQECLEKAFQSAVNSLQDKNPWNDQPTLRQLCNVLSCLPSLKEEAAIAISAQFYILDRDLMKENLEDGDDGEWATSAIEPSDEADTEPKVKYDLEKFSSVLCNGNCTENPDGFLNWEKPLYRCVICADSDLCEPCAEQLVNPTGEEAPGLVWRTYCGVGHEHIKGPAKGWLGIKDGKIMIEGKEPVEFSEWLEELKDVKWPRAWEEFWRG